jgi:actin-related protein
MLKGFPERFLIEMKKMKKYLKNNTKCRLLAHPSRDTLCWQGGSICANLSSMKSSWVTKAEYFEQRGGLLAKKLL